MNDDFVNDNEITKNDVLDIVAWVYRNNECLVVDSIDWLCRDKAPKSHLPLSPLQNPLVSDVSSFPAVRLLHRAYCKRE